MRNNINDILTYGQRLHIWWWSLSNEKRWNKYHELVGKGMSTIFAYMDVKNEK